VLRLTSVTKRYGSLTALDSVSLSLQHGEFFGLLGPNGAGKSTLMALVAGLRSPDAGELTLDGQPFTRDRLDLRARLGFVPQTLALYEDLSAEENLGIFGRLYGLSGSTLSQRIHDGLAAAQLLDRRRDRVKTFSGGMQRRLNIVAALLHRPGLLLCDEPTVGVDPQSRNAIFEFLQRLNRDGLTVVYSTHYMEEATRLCSRIGIIDHGRILALGTLPELLTRLPSGEKLRIAPASGDDAHLAALRRFGTLARDDEGHLLALRPGVRLSEVFAALEALGVDPVHLQLARPDLEDLFLHLTGKSLRDS
jgi:ABC-2 type transport system ATP-binding protein